MNSLNTRGSPLGGPTIAAIGVLLFATSGAANAQETPRPKQLPVQRPPVATKAPPVVQHPPVVQQRKQMPEPAARPAAPPPAARPVPNPAVQPANPEAGRAVPNKKGNPIPGNGV